MPINIDDYLDEHDKKEIAKDLFREQLNKESLGIHISNAAYYVAMEAVSELFEESLEEKLVSKLKEVIEDLSSYTVFNEGGYGQPATKGQKILDKAVEDSAKEIEDKVHEIMAEKVQKLNDLDECWLRDLVANSGLKLTIEV